MNFEIGKVLSRPRTHTVERAAAARRQRPVDGDGHPTWCARGHHCTACRNGRTGPTTVGEHASEPEVWDTAHGRVVATRHRSASNGTDWVEIRTVVALPSDEATAERLTRHLIATGHLVLSRVFADSTDQREGERL
jgi:hypothetical protein